MKKIILALTILSNIYGNTTITTLFYQKEMFAEDKWLKQENGSGGKILKYKNNYMYHYPLNLYKCILQNKHNIEIIAIMKDKIIFNFIKDKTYYKKRTPQGIIELNCEN